MRTRDHICVFWIAQNGEVRAGVVWISGGRPISSEEPGRPASGTESRYSRVGALVACRVISRH